MEMSAEPLLHVFGNGGHEARDELFDAVVRPTQHGLSIAVSTTVIEDVVLEELILVKQRQRQVIGQEIAVRTGPFDALHGEMECVGVDPPRQESSSVPVGILDYHHL